MAVSPLLTVPVVAVVAALGVPAVGAPPAGTATVTPVLTSMPFGAGPGQRVTHTITLSGSGTGVVAGVRVTFTTTVDLDGAVARANQGRCSAVTPRAVTCVVGDVHLPATAMPTITITGTMHAADPGALVQNRVSLVSAHPSAAPADEVASNAYLIPGSAAAPSGQPSARAAAAARSHRETGGDAASTWAVVAAVAGVALAGLLVLWRLRSRRS